MEIWKFKAIDHHTVDNYNTADFYNISFEAQGALVET